MAEYLGTHFRRCLTKEEREALFKQYPRPDVACCLSPKADKFMMDFLGKRFPREYDTTLSKLQTAVLAITRPLSSAWLQLVEEGQEEEPNMLLPASEVLMLIQCTLCLVGNASELISQTRRAKILEQIDQSWSKYGSDSFPSSQDSLFGDEFQSTLTKKVEKDSALSKAAFITKKNVSHKGGSSTNQDGRRGRQFFRGSPPVRYGDRQGKSFFPYGQSQFRKDSSPRSHPNYNKGYQQPGQGRRSLFHEPKLPNRETQQSRPSPS